MSKYQFEDMDDGYEVFYRGKSLGRIVGIIEASGRHSFYLGCDNRDEPRIYRGKDKAAEALHTIKGIIEDAKKRRLSTEELIVRAWEDRPRASRF